MLENDAMRSGREYRAECVAELAQDVERRAPARLSRYVELRFHYLYAGGAWGREARAVVALAERLGVEVSAEQLMFSDVRDLQGPPGADVKVWAKPSPTPSTRIRCGIETRRSRV